MRQSNIVAATLLLFALTGCGGATEESFEAVDYVPDTGWSDDEWASGFYEDWFGKQLRAMGEPGLSSTADLHGFRERFRLLVLPSFHPASAYRIDVRDDGDALARWVRLDGAGGYEPGAIACQGERPLNQAESRTWFSEPAATRLQSFSREDRESFCFDGTTYVFEYLDENGRQYVVRHCEMAEPLQVLSEQLQELGPRGPFQNLACLLP